MRRHTEAALHCDLGHASIVAEEWFEPIDILKLSQSHHLQLSLLPISNATFGFPDRWGPNRLERVGALFFLPAGQSVRARSDCRIQRSIFCRIDPEALSSWFDRDIEWTDPRLRGSVDMACGPVRQLLCRLADEIRAPGFASEAMVELLIAQIGVELSRYFLNIDEVRKTGGLAPWRLRLIDDFIANTTGTVSLSALAQACNLSVRHLTRAFRESQGRSLAELVAERRIEEARRLLRSGLTIKEVAYATGFSAPTNFATAFRRATGESPREYARHAQCAEEIFN